MNRPRSILAPRQSRGNAVLTALVGALMALSAGACAGEEAKPPTAPPYKNDSAVLKVIEGLGERSSVTLPRFKVESKSDIFGCKNIGPTTYGMTLRMAYAPERETALYCGGGHSDIRSNNVWEFHLGSNTWNMAFEPDGGNQGHFKDVLMFLGNKLAKPDYQMTDAEKKRFEEVRPWWKANVILKDGQITTTRGGPILPGHTWDTLVYEPNVRRLIHGTGAYCSNTAVLWSRYNDVPLEEVTKQLDKTYTGIWTFDPWKAQWIRHRHEAGKPMAQMRGMGGSMTYIPDLGKVIWYVAASNVSPHAFEMWSWNVARDEWTELKPNGGKGIAELVKANVAPIAEQQMAYSMKDRKLVAVLGKDTFAYDIAKNEWANLGAEIPKLPMFTPEGAHDMWTTFAYDSNADVFLLSDGNYAGKVAFFSLSTGKWEVVAAVGGGCPTSDFGGGPINPNCSKGYYDPKYNVFVLHGISTGSVWLYRHAKTASGQERGMPK